MIKFEADKIVFETEGATATIVMVDLIRAGDTANLLRWATCMQIAALHRSITDAQKRASEQAVPDIEELFDRVTSRLKRFAGKPDGVEEVV